MGSPARRLTKTFARCRSLAGIFRITVKKLVRRYPRRFRIPAGSLLGGLIGLIGGIPGLLIGLLLGYLLGELAAQSSAEKKILDYLENPGAQRFYEGEPGLAAWCALGVLIAAEDSGPFPGGEGIQKQVRLGASRVFAGFPAEPYLAEQFTRLAWSRREKLNPDLLAESLAARRLSSGGTGNLGRGLSGLAGGEKARRLAREIRLTLDPAAANEKEPEQSVLKDPWKILGLPPGTDQRELKAHYRRLAKQFHPDELQILDEKQREAAGRAFIAIKEAYRELSDGH